MKISKVSDIMPLVKSTEILDDARKNGYAIGALNANCLEMIPPLIWAAEEVRSPLILQIGKRFLDYFSPFEIAAFAIDMAKRASVPVCVHLDHSNTVDLALQCLNAGFTSLMYDGSSLPVNENIENLKYLVKIASEKGIPVEGEIGQVLISNGTYSFEDLESKMTDPLEAKQFVEATGISLVAVAIGNLHRMRTRQATLDFDRIEAIRSSVDVPLVMHGSSGITDEDISKAVKCGVSKVNIATEFNAVFCDGIRATCSDSPNEIFPMTIMSGGIKAVKDLAIERLKPLGCYGKA